MLSKCIIGSRPKQSGGDKCACCVGVAKLMLDILAQLGSGDDLVLQHSGPSALLLLGPPGMGESALRYTTINQQDCCGVDADWRAVQLPMLWTMAGQIL